MDAASPKLAPLVLVVGPSGAGKDTLIEGASHRLADRGWALFPRRTVTRPAMPGNEDHDSVTQAAFDIVEQGGGYLLSWRAHGLAYGIPAWIEESRRSGIMVVINVSRATIESARRRLQPVRIVYVEAPPKILAERLARRGREAGDEIERRLRRATAERPDGHDVTVVDNSGEPDTAVAAFVDLLERFRAECSASV